MARRAALARRRAHGLVGGPPLSDGHAAQTHAASDVVPLERLPYNGYDVLEPDIDFDRWRLAVSGAVAGPGEYTLDQVRHLPKVVQNTRHVCIEGWGSSSSDARSGLRAVRWPANRPLGDEEEGGTSPPGRQDRFILDDSGGEEISSVAVPPGP